MEEHYQVRETDLDGTRHLRPRPECTGNVECHQCAGLGEARTRQGCRRTPCLILNNPEAGLSLNTGSSVRPLMRSNNLIRLCFLVNYRGGPCSFRVLEGFPKRFGFLHLGRHLARYPPPRSPPVSLLYPRGSNVPRQPLASQMTAKFLLL